MAAAETVSHGINLSPVVSLLAAGVTAVPLFKRFGLDAVLGYLAAGILIGPSALGLFNDPSSIMHVAELGVVMFLFVIGLEMQPSRLWGLRRDILGLGLLQVIVCGLLLTGAGVLLGYPIPSAFVFGMGFVLTSTAIVFQMLGDRGELSTSKGQRIISILLLEDMAIVPLLAVLALIAPGGGTTTAHGELLQVAIGISAIIGVILIGRYMLNPMFRILAQANAREVMTAAALLVVLGAALAMQVGGLSMAMGAFLAGVLLSESSFRHQLEADIEPFRGILLGLFFLGVGMALDVRLVVENAALVAAYVAIFMTVKGIGIYTVARFFGSSNGEAIERAALMAQGGEFAFVLYAAATSSAIIGPETGAIFTTTVIISMALSPIITNAARRIAPTTTLSMDGVQEPDGLTGNILIIGFGRFGQIVSQPLLARGLDVAIIDTDVELIEAATQFGFKVYYGDGSRLDILHAAGAGQTQTIMICVDKPEVAVRIATLVKAEFLLIPVMARSFDRGAALALLGAGVDYEMRETLESAFAFGFDALKRLGISEQDAERTMTDVRRRDAQRFELQIAEGLYAGGEYFQGNQPTPTPLTVPRRLARAGNDEAAALLGRSAQEDR